MRYRLHTRIPAALLTALALSGCSLLPKEVQETPPPLVAPVKSAKEIYTVGRGDVADRQKLSVVFAAASQSTLMFKQGGRLRQRYVQAGDKVSRGQLLAELETGSLDAQVQLGQINLEKAQLRLEQAREKARALKGAMDPFEEKFLVMDVRTAQVSLDSLWAQRKDAQLYAPFDGIVSEATGNPGDQVAAFFPVVTVQDPSNLVLKADVDDAVSARLVVGQAVQVEFSEFGSSLLDGTLAGVPSAKTGPANLGGAGSSGGAAGKQGIITLKEPRKDAKLGMTGRAWVILEQKKSVLLVPNAAVRAYAGRKYVVVVDGDAKREVDVTTGIVGELQTEITRGLSEGQKVMGK